jgi:hypothetical protein
VAAAGNDQMVEQADIDERQRAREFGRDAAVGFTRLAVAGRVIVAQYDGRGVVVEGPLHDLPRIHGRAVDGPAK